MRSSASNFRNYNSKYSSKVLYRREFSRTTGSKAIDKSSFTPLFKFPAVIDCAFRLWVAVCIFPVGYRVSSSKRPSTYLGSCSRHFSMSYCSLEAGHFCQGESSLSMLPDDQLIISGLGSCIYTAEIVAPRSRQIPNILSPLPGCFLLQGCMSK